MEPLVAECLERSTALLRANVVPSGILASSPTARAESRRYTSIFGRDAAICALGMAVSGESLLIEGAVSGLRTLARHQADNGQIPKYVKPDTGEVDFWYSGCIDATLWWLLAIPFVDRHAGTSLAGEFAEKIDKAIVWLTCQEHPTWRLLQQNEASDWADIMPRSGFVLYTNALWYLVKRRYDLPEQKVTRDYLNLLFHPHGNVVPEHRRARLLTHYIRNHTKPSPFYLSFVNFSFWGDEIDIFGNLLAGLAGVADSSRMTKIADGIMRLGAHRPYPVRAVGHPLQPGEPLWRLYMQRHRQNYPFQYHNGGIWPFIGGFWVLFLARLGRTADGWTELASLAESLRVAEWMFAEWLNGADGTPGGMSGQSWNAALFLLAHRTLTSSINFFP